jgi:hypothetical protein
MLDTLIGPALLILILFVVLAIDGQPDRDPLYGKRLTAPFAPTRYCDHPHGKTHIRSNGTGGMGQQCEH